MEIAMKNLHLKSSQQNHPQSSDPTHYQDGTQRPKAGPTLQSKAVSKNEIIITRSQFREAAWLFKQYGLQKPGWLRTRFMNNQRRRKALNEVLREASLDQALCGSAAKKDWSGLLHELWHQINEVPLCK